MQDSTNPPLVIDVAQQSYAERFTSLRATLLDPNGLFSGSQMHADLLALLPLAKAHGDDSAELAQLYALLALLQGKRDEREEQLAYGEQCLAIQRRNPVLPPEELLALHYSLSLGVAELERPEQVIEHLRAAIALLPQDRSLSPRQQFGLRQELGYWLHQHGDYAAARAHNQQLLADAEATFGADEADLTGMLTNLAQNAYELHDWTASEAYLQRVVSLSRQHGKLEIELDGLFQLGVLAHERGDNPHALAYFEQRLQLAREADDDYLLERAEEDLAEFHRRAAN
ncbi:tetratricopeptide repeat protein [Pseudomonas sp. PDM14]|uniref:tetratricopeptide repeat protein n=1 Tax=Pseudomonas sp. PDM14 TaxID=2769288 RepID=UPI00177EAE08|nr:tetratricopeptide repeat protein [Pseudomonas sp. PDM14]MBD9483502.1 tetratricopeptide repeat protein [Pseudomonas sp. PDM14]